MVTGAGLQRRAGWDRDGTCSSTVAPFFSRMATASTLSTAAASMRACMDKKHVCF